MAVSKVANMGVLGAEVFGRCIGRLWDHEGRLMGCEGSVSYCYFCWIPMSYKAFRRLSIVALLMIRTSCAQPIALLYD